MLLEGLLLTYFTLVLVVDIWTLLVVRRLEKTLEKMRSSQRRV